MRASHVLVMFYVAGALLVSYAGLSMFAAVSDMLARLPIVR